MHRKACVRRYTVSTAATGTRSKEACVFRLPDRALKSGGGVTRWINYLVRPHMPELGGVDVTKFRLRDMKSCLGRSE
jgi:hypothetical protein